MSEKILTIDASRFAAEVLEHAGPVVVDFYSTECPPCEALAAKYEGFADVYGDDVKFVKVFRQGNRALAEALGVRSSPTVLFFDHGRQLGEVLTGGIKRADLQHSLEALLAPERVKVLRQRVRRWRTECDVLVIGAGPAGLTAGIYAAQAKLRTIAVDRGMAGGNLNITHQVSNFPGFPDPQPGYLLAHNMAEHARRAGVELRQAVDITAVNPHARSIVLDDVETIVAKKIVLATGSSPRLLGVKGEREYRGKGISYCATCDAKYYDDKHVIVIGGGNSAVEEALFIAKFARKVTIVHQFKELQANRQAQEKAFAEPKIEFVFAHEPREFVARGHTVGEVIVEDLDTGVLSRLACDGVFIFAGMQPNLEVAGELLALDRFGYVQVDEEMRTNLPHVYAAGDVRSKPFRQMTTAVSDGTIAAMSLARALGA